MANPQPAYILYRDWKQEIVPVSFTTEDLEWKGHSCLQILAWAEVCDLGTVHEAGLPTASSLVNCLGELQYNHLSWVNSSFGCFIGHEV